MYHSSSNGIPLGAQINPKKFKVILFDIGIHQQLMKLDISKYIVTDDFNAINKGCLAEVFTGLELLHACSPFRKEALFYWHREARGSNAEIDYVLFGWGVAKIKLSAVGFLQFLAPTLMLIISITIFKEDFPVAKLPGYILVWLALGIYIGMRFKRE